MRNRSQEPVEVHRFRIEEDLDDRLDAYLADRLRLSRNRVAELIDTDHVRVNDSPVRKSRRIRLGDRVEVRVPPSPPTEVIPEPLSIEIVYEDDDLVVVNKSAGMVVHPAVGHRSGTLVNGLLHRLGSLSTIGEPDRLQRPRRFRLRLRRIPALLFQDIDERIDRVKVALQAL